MDDLILAEPLRGIAFVFWQPAAFHGILIERAGDHPRNARTVIRHAPPDLGGHVEDCVHRAEASQHPLRGVAAASGLEGEERLRAGREIDDLGLVCKLGCDGAKASSLWGQRASCPLTGRIPAGRMPAGPTARMAVLRVCKQALDLSLHFGPTGAEADARAQKEAARIHADKFTTHEPAALRQSADTARALRGRDVGVEAFDEIVCYTHAHEVCGKWKDWNLREARE